MQILRLKDYTYQKFRSPDFFWRSLSIWLSIYLPISLTLWDILFTARSIITSMPWNWGCIWENSSWVARSYLEKELDLFIYALQPMLIGHSLTRWPFNSMGLFDPLSIPYKSVLYVFMNSMKWGEWTESHSPGRNEDSGLQTNWLFMSLPRVVKPPIFFHHHLSSISHLISPRWSCLVFKPCLAFRGASTSGRVSTSSRAIG